jgi:hypothetical protein
MQPSLRREIEEAAVALVARHGTQVLATARRYAATPEDAEDAYQRGLEILLTKAPTTSEADLVPWLKTVVIRTFQGTVTPGGVSARKASQPVRYLRSLLRPSCALAADAPTRMRLPSISRTTRPPEAGACP